MTKASRIIVATLALVAMLTAGGNLALAQSTAKKGGVVPGPTLDKVELQTTADRASARIQTSDADKKELLACVQSKNTEQTKALLLRNGFTAKQLEGAMFEFQDNTGGKGTPQNIKITIGATCCPPKIVIVIRF